MAKKTAKTADAAPMQAFHYFGSTAFNWSVAPTRAEVLAKLARAAGADIIRANVKAHGGLYAWTVRVDAPQATNYEINNYQPQGVPCSEAQEFNLQNAKGHSLPYLRAPRT